MQSAFVLAEKSRMGDPHPSSQRIACGNVRAGRFDVGPFLRALVYGHLV